MNCFWPAWSHFAMCFFYRKILSKINNAYTKIYEMKLNHKSKRSNLPFLSKTREIIKNNEPGQRFEWKYSSTNNKTTIGIGYLIRTRHSDMYDTECLAYIDELIRRYASNALFNVHSINFILHLTKIYSRSCSLFCGLFFHIKQYVRINGRNIDSGRTYGVVLCKPKYRSDKDFMTSNFPFSGRNLKSTPISDVNYIR